VVAAAAARTRKNDEVAAGAAPVLRSAAQRQHHQPPKQDSNNDKKKETNRTHADILWSYVFNLERARRENKNSTNNRNDLLKPARALAFWLEREAVAAGGKPTRQITTTTTTTTTISASTASSTNSTILFQEEEEPLQRASVQAIRAAASVNDYRLILQLMESVRNYCASRAVASSNVIDKTAVRLDPRILGEAVAALGQKTTVRPGRITKLWNEWTGATADNTTTNSTNGSATIAATAVVTPREGNAYLQALIAKGRLRGALEQYHKWKDDFDNNNNRDSTSNNILTDAYTCSLLINALTESIADDDGAKKQTAKSFSSPLVLQYSELLTPWISPVCWQWNEAVRLLDRSVSVLSNDDDNDNKDWNNAVWTALLQLNRRATQVFSRRLYDGSEHAVQVLELLQARHIPPDRVTSALLLSSLTDWELAVSLLRQSQQPQNSSSDGGWWSMASPPNEYQYSAVMAVCARGGQSNITLQLLQELDETDSSSLSSLSVNTYMYNSVLQALTVTAPRSLRPGRKAATQATRRRAQERIRLALDLLQNHLMSPPPSSSCCQPDATTYNTMLAVVVSVHPLLKEPDWDELALQFPDLFRLTGDNDDLYQKSVAPSQRESLVLNLLQDMRGKSIPCNVLTYKHAIQAIGGGSRNNGRKTHTLLGILERGLDELQKKQERVQLYSEALSMRADVGDFSGVAQILKFMMDHGGKVNNEVFIHIITSLANGNFTSSLPALLQRTISSNDEAQKVAASYGVNLAKLALGPVDASILSAAISCCLQARDFESARAVLTQMREMDLRPSQESLQEIVSAYARIALEQDASRYNDQRFPAGDSAPRSLGNKQAKSAYAILASIEEPPASLVSLVSRACSSAGLFREAHRLVRLLHRRVLSARFSPDASTDHRTNVSRRTNENECEKILPALHRSLLKHCAYQGNITNALRLCEDIQYLSLKVATADSNNEVPSLLQSDGGHSTLAFDYDTYAVLEPEGGLGMKAIDWKSLLTAASKSGHWRVCLTTLQFLRPYLENTHPSLAIDEEHRLHLDQEYSRLESAMNTAVKCLAVRSQYAWIVRAIDDWIEWCGRRPPRVSVLSAIRILASRGRGDEVNTLLSRCTALSCSNTKGDMESYESMLHVGAITALYNNGLYDEADEAFVAAITKHVLPFNLELKTYGSESRVTLDLHGLNLAVAHSAVRIALQQEALSAEGDSSGNDMVIVTGRGLNSALRMRPVLRPEVQHMLVEEFYPPLSTMSVPNNMGAILVTSEDIAEWVSHQRQQKGIRMLLIAAMLKDFAGPGGRLQNALAQAAMSTTLLVERTNIGITNTADG